MQEFITIAIAHLLAVASPGPDFAVVLKQSVNGGVRAGMWTSAGVGTGIFLHVAYCVLGVALLLSRVDWLFVVVKLIAAAYLGWLGLQALWHAWRSAEVVRAGAGAELAPMRAFSTGFLTNGLNPKATLFFLALWTVVISPQTPVTIQALYGLYLALATFAWFAMLSRLLGQQRVRGLLLSSGKWFEASMGVVLLFLAVQIAVTA
ncbi:MAG: LysE family translocator [Gammaproteobacteria bacterium]|nr:LysE family translocator [Gammaproteobacteria bacterium]MYH45780.1 LysE family translocator [Gammaproteobacteria bacterium]MYL12730.1 LysE family translocator [Gammaproteobacteria bacterium]